jgi:hypothetical protein
MGLKEAGPYFQRSMSNAVLAGLGYRIFELFMDDVLIHGKVVVGLQKTGPSMR